MAARTADAQLDTGNLWWLWLVAGVLWVVVGIVIVQFDSASVRTVGVIVGVMLFVAGLQYLVVGSLADHAKWAWYVFGAVLGVVGLVAMLNPVQTFASLADMLGFVFAFVGIVWIVEAVGTKDDNPLWWFGLIAGIIMVVLGFDTGGQFFIDKAYTLLVFAGAWALMKGITDIILAFQIRRSGPPRLAI